MKLLIFLSVAFCCTLSFAQAQQKTVTPLQNPLEITADESLEWQRDDKIFVARKNAMAKQGPSSVSAEILTAHYREEKGSGMDIWKVEAEKNVVIRSQESAAFGDQADYDLQKGLAIMTGQNLRMESPDQTLTARTRFEYHVQDGRVKALGGAKITRKNINGHGDTLEADEISALLQQNEKGQRVLKTLEARGHVVITTAQEIVTGAYGIYDANLNKATLTGNVTIRRGQNLLQGEKAEVNLNTNVSRIFGGSAAGGRVRGVFYPGSEKNKGP